MAVSHQGLRRELVPSRVAKQVVAKHGGSLTDHGLGSPRHFGCVCVCWVSVCWVHVCTFACLCDQPEVLLGFGVPTTHLSGQFSSTHQVRFYKLATSLAP